MIFLDLTNDQICAQFLTYEIFQSEEIEKLKQIVKDQQKLIDKASSDGPIIWIGQINVKFHKLIQKSSGSDHNVDPFFWPRRWFPTLKDEIIYEIRKTE